MSCRVSSRPANKNALLKVVILGDGGVGKSCLMNRFVSNQFDEQSFHTIGVEFLNKDIKINGETYTLQIWDTAGQERFRTLRTPFYRGSDICILTYAVNDKYSFENICLWQNEFLRYANVKDKTSFPFIVVGNKCDIPASERQVSLDVVQSWCLENAISSYIETSAKNAENVETAFNMAVEHWSQTEAKADRSSGHSTVMSHDETIDLTKKSQDSSMGNRNSCCSGSSSLIGVEEGERDLSGS